MYVKVHEEGDQWFRDDNGALVGKTRIISGEEACTVHISTDKGAVVIADYGYLDEDSLFVSLCQRLTCNYRCLRMCNPNCRYTTKTIPSSGYYIYVSD